MAEAIILEFTSPDATALYNTVNGILGFDSGVATS